MHPTAITLACLTPRRAGGLVPRAVWARIKLAWQVRTRMARKNMLKIMLAAARALNRHDGIPAGKMTQQRLHAARRRHAANSLGGTSERRKRERRSDARDW
jgi:hypothetical protein